MFNLVIMNTPNKNDNTAVLIFVALFFICCCCCSSSVISGGGLFLKSDKKDDSSPSKKDDSSPSKQYTLRSANTAFNDNGAGKVYYLDRHNVSCNIDSLGGINGFQLKTDNDNATMQYEYKCLNG